MWPANNLIWQAFPPDHQILLFRLYIAMLAVDLKFISCSQNCQHQRNVFFLFFHSRLISFFSLPCRQDGCIWKGNKMWSHVKSFHYLTMIYFTTRTPNSNKMRTKKKQYARWDAEIMLQCKQTRHYGPASIIFSSPQNCCYSFSLLYIIFINMIKE